MAVSDAQPGKQAQQRQAVASLNRLVVSSADIGLIMKDAVRQLAGGLGMEYAYVLELRPGRATFVLREGLGWKRGSVGRAVIKAGPHSPSGYAVMSGEPVVISDLRHDRRFKNPSLLREHGIISGLTDVVRGQNGPFGAVGAYSRRAHTCTDDDVYFIQSIAGILATAVRNHQAGRELQHSEMRMRAIVNTAVDAIITIDERGLIDSINPAAERLFGYSSDWLVGQNVSHLMPEPFRSEHDVYIRNYLRTGKARIIGIGREVIGRRSDGSTFPMNLSVSEFRIGDRRMFTGIVHDLSDRRRLEREILEISAAEQRRIGQDLHDGLCQELAGIAFGTEVLARKLEAESSPRVSDVRKLGQLLDESISHARSLARGLNPVNLLADGLVAALDELANNISQIYGISCAFRCDDELLIKDNGVATHLYRIAQEATTNAIKHGKAKKIQIRLARGGGKIMLSIRDNGGGFGRSKTRSSGMGLHTMQYRAQLVGAVLQISSIRTGGTQVACTLRDPSSVGEP